MIDGRKVVAAAGTAEVLGSKAVRFHTLYVTAETDNTGVMAVGDSTVVATVLTRRGTPLVAGDTLVVEDSSLGMVWLDSTVNGDGVTFNYLP